MKRYCFILPLLLFFWATLFLSCDKVKPPYMNVTDVADCPVPDFPAVATPQKTLLIEEFTGHRCVYCPGGAHYIDQIKQQSYGDRVMVLAIHASILADPEPGNYSLDLRPGTHGEELYSYFAIPNEPRAGFNREKLDGTNNFYGTPASWQAKAEQVLSQSPVVTLQIINNYDSSTRKLCSHVKTRFLAANAQNLKIALFISEDSIIGYQSNNNTAYGTVPDIVDYVFMNVMRDEFAGTFGEVLTTGGVSQDSSIIRTYKKILDPAWNVKYCKVVAYVYDTDTDVVLQAAEEKVY
ncbi:MAG TPA: Omp28-related outer membrane protein [Bacteroidales bacterium]|nr:Omp28-related outer membrane protein [Bacteroidales bacterium]